MLSPLYQSLGPLAWRRAAAAVAASIWDSATSLWKLDEASGTRSDSIGSNHLTDNNTVEYTNLGPAQTMAHFNHAAQEFLLHNGGWGNMGTFTVNLWCKIDPFAPNNYYNMFTIRNVVTVGTYVAGGKVAYLSAGTYDGVSYPSAASAWGPTYIPEEGAAMFMVSAVYTPTAIRLYVDGVQRFTAVTQGSPVYDNNYLSGFGGSSFISPAGPGAYHWSGLIGRASVWSGDKGADIAAWYNAGRGLDYEELPNTTGLVSFYRMKETSGTRYDAHGVNHLTAINTVECNALGPSGSVAHVRPSYAEGLTYASPVIDTSGDFTVLQWFRMNDATPGSPNKYCYPWKDSTGNRAGLFLESEYAGWHRIYHRQGYGAGQEVGPGAGVTANRNIGRWLLIAYTYTVSTTTARVKVLGGGNSTWLDDVYTLPATLDLRVATGGVNGLDQDCGPLGIWNVVLDDATIESIFNSGVAKRRADLTAGEATGLQHYWNFTETTGTRSDSQGSAHFVGSTLSHRVSRAANLPGRVARFVAGNAEFLSVADAAALDLTASYTLSAWIYLPDSANYRGVISRGQFSQANSYDLHATPSLPLRGYHGTTEVHASPPILYTGAWVHIMRVYSHTEQKVTQYINNESCAIVTSVAALGDTTAGLYLGALTWGGGTAYYMNGLVSTVMIAPVAFDAGQRAELWNNGDGAVLP